MDGMYDSDHLCFVLSQCDRDYDIPNYRKQNRALEVDLAPELKKLRDMKGKLVERKKQWETAHESYDENISKAKFFEDEIKELHLKYGIKTPNDKLKRKRGEYNDSTSKQFLMHMYPIIYCEFSDSKTSSPITIYAYPAVNCRNEGGRAAKASFRLAGSRECCRKRILPSHKTN
jgi:hypothetical protein